VRATSLRTLAEYAAAAGGEVRGDGALAIERIAAIDEADERSLTFATDERYLRAACKSRAAAVLTGRDVAAALPTATKPMVLVESARVGLGTLLRVLEPARPSGPFVHPSAVVDVDARLGERVWIGPQVVVGAHAHVGDDAVLLAGATVGANARVGARTIMHPRAMLLDDCVAGARVVLHAGCVVGSDGFGFMLADGRLVRIPQIGNVELGDDVEIGANACVDRAQTGTTRIGRGTKIDNLVQIGHNCRIGEDCGVAALVGFAGSTTIGDHVSVGGQAGFRGHLVVGSRVRVAGRAQVWGDIPDDAFVGGAPAHDHREELRRQVRVRNLDKLYARVDALESK